MLVNGYSYKNIKKAANFLKKGEPIAFPTETVYGLGANIYNKKSVAKIFEIKQRPFFDPLIVHIANLKQLEEIAKIEDERIYLLAKHFWPGPLTLVLPKQKRISYLITAGLETVAIRMPSNIIALSLIQELNFPIAAPSANLFTHLSPTTAQHVQKQLGNKIKLILDGGKTTCGVESTILSIEKNKKPVVLRMGGLPIENIEKIIGKIIIPAKKSRKVLAPGNLKNHYAPQKPLIIINNEKEIPKYLKNNKQKIGYLAFRKINNKKIFNDYKILSSQGDFKEAASNFFDYLHQLDDGPAEIILAEKIKEVNLGKAMMERLTKAAHR